MPSSVFFSLYFNLRSVKIPALKLCYWKLKNDLLMNMNKGYVSLLVLLDHKCRIWYRRSRDPNTNTANRVWPWRRSSFVVRFVCNSSITANSGWWHDVWCLWSVFWSFSRALSWPSTVFDLCQQDIWCYYSYIHMSHHNQLLSTKFGGILRYVKNDVNRAAKMPDYWTVNREDLGTRLNCFGSDCKTEEHFTRFTRKK